MMRSPEYVPTREELAAWRRGELSLAALVLGQQPIEQEAGRAPRTPVPDAGAEDELRNDPHGSGDHFPWLLSRVLAPLRAGAASGRAVARHVRVRRELVYQALAELERGGAVLREGKRRGSRYRLAGS